MENTIIRLHQGKTYSYQGLSMTAGQWCSRMGLGYPYFYQMIKHCDGDVEEAIKTIFDYLNSDQ